MPRYAALCCRLSSLHSNALIQRSLSSSARRYEALDASTARINKRPELVLPQPLQEPDVKTNPYAQYGMFPSSALVEQQAILQVLLAGGNLTRAKALWERMQKVFFKHREKRQDDYADHLLSSEHELEARLKDIVPMQTHASFIRAFFRAALGFRDQPGSNLNHPDDSPKAVQERKRKRKDLVKQAWEWWHMLRRGSNEYGVPDSQVVAALLKGLIQIGNADDALMYESRITALIEDLPKLGYNLTDILQDPIFDSEAPAALGFLPPSDTLAFLSNLVRSSGSTTLSKLVTSAQQALDSSTESARSDPLEGVTKLDPTSHIVKGEELDKTAVPFKLDSLRSHLASITGHRSEHSDPYLRQKLLEESAYDTARQQYDHIQQTLKENNVTAANAPKVLKDYVWEWTQLLSKRISEHTSAKISKERTSLLTFQFHEQAFFSLLQPEHLAFTTITSLLNLVQSEGGAVVDGTATSTACIFLGKAVEREYITQTLTEMDPKGFEARIKRNMEESEFVKSREHALSKMWKEHNQKLEEAETLEAANGAERELRRSMEGPSSGIKWTQSIRARVGAQLIVWLLDCAKVTRTTEVTEVDENGVLQEKVVSEEQPAFYHSYQYIKGAKLGVIRVNEHILARLEHDPLDMSLYTRELPMVIPPRPWLDWDQGGYITHRTEVVRFHRDSAEQAAHLKAASAAGHMSEIYAALDYLGSTPWKVNRKVYDIVSQVWNTGESIADIPIKDPLVSIKDPEKPQDADTNIEARQSWRRQLQQVAKERLNAHSQRCTINYQLEIARAFLGETLYFPHNMDFRGRSYPIPPNLSHIGNDLSRGLLTFAESKPLGDKGLYWLKVHLANTFGYDKFSFDERAQFATDHLEDIHDSAEKPLQGQRWWAQAEDPWQCLAACFEISSAVKSGDPATYACALPVQQDGTCNGLQHYAALGGDLAGAEAVNLVNAERPGDVYGKVAQTVSKAIDRDAEAGYELAKLLQGKITRKTVKQTVMTTVYGVTFIGAKKMIQKQLFAAESVPEHRVFDASVYIARKTFEGIGDIFKGATALQKWLAHVARLVSGSYPEHRLQGPGKPAKMTTMAWTTPLGLPVVQPYRKPNRKQISTALQTIFLEDPNTPSSVDTRSQQSAMPPNYIHSLDATHMMMTALECKKDGINFASVHDSFWSHASDVDVLARNLRTAFVDLHSRPLLEDLRSEVLQRYAGFRIPRGELPNATRSALGMPLRRQTKAAAEAADLDEGLDDGLDFSDLESGPTSLPSLSGADDSVHDLSEDDVAQLRPESEASQSKAKDLPNTVLLSDILPRLPARGEFDIKQVGESSYFFS